MNGEKEAKSLEKLVTTSKAIPKLNTKVEAFRCVHCNRFLGYVALIEGTVAIKCRRCKTWCIIDVQQEIIDNNSDESIPQEILDKTTPVAYDKRKVE